MEQMSRRRFIQGTAALSGAYILGGCGQEAQSSITLPSAAETQTINSGASANMPAVRGEQVQINPPPPPRQIDCFIPGERYTHVLTNELLNAYTFDDGPSPYNTETVLRVLAQYGIKATFFVVGVNVRAWPEILQRIVDEGHEIGNHSVYHDPYQDVALANQIGPNQHIIHDTVGIYPVVNRAPGLTQGPNILYACKQNNMYELATNMDTNDWRGNPRLNPTELYNEHVRVYQNGGVWLYHDGGNSRPTPAALPNLIQFDQNKGAKLVTATQLMNSGIPVPGTSIFSRLEDSSSELIDTEISEESIGTNCNYDPKAELVTRLGDVSLKRAERSRIVEVLADIEEHEKAA